MRRVSLFARREGLEVAMTPMIDVVFLLLVFFIWTASFQIPEQSLSSSIAAPPVGQGAAIETPLAAEDDFDQVVVRVVADGEAVRWRVNDQPVDNRRQLRSRLAAIASVRRTAPVVLHPDSDVPLGAVIATYDVARLAGFASIQFATPAEAP